jgi:hypothetical protein
MSFLQLYLALENPLNNCEQKFVGGSAANAHAISFSKIVVNDAAVLQLRSRREISKPCGVTVRY